VKIKFVKLDPNAQTPFQATVGSAGFDLVATSKTRIGNNLVSYGTGIAVEIPNGYVGLLYPRSSCYKAGMLLTNCVGVIDSDYRGEVKAVFSAEFWNKEYNPGDRIAQLIIQKLPAVEYVEVQELSQTERGAGGYGSTGQ
jgi:dUTP pyrophosphatase